jgi:hypothetical protein
VASQDGYLYVYQIAAQEGGDCQMIKKHDLRNIDPPPPPPASRQPGKYPLAATNDQTLVLIFPHYYLTRNTTSCCAI